MFKWLILLSTVDNAELVFISSIYWIAIYPADRAITAFERPEPGHASSVLLQEVKNNENVKTVALMQRVVAVNRLRKAQGPGGPGGRGGREGRRGRGGCTWVNFAGYVPLASQGPYPITMPRRLRYVYMEIQFLYRRFNTTIKSSTEVNYFDLPHVC